MAFLRLLPHSGHCQAIPNGRNTGFREGGTYCYAKTLIVPEGSKGCRILFFEGVYGNAWVYVDGQLAAYHPYGYIGFFADLTRFLQKGGEHEIRVSVKNSAQNSRWYSGGGIYRNVWLLESSQEAFWEPGSLQVSTQQMNPDQSTVLQVSAWAVNQGESPVEGVARFQVEGVKAEAPFSLQGGQREKVAVCLTVAAPRLWSAETPELSWAKVQMWAGEALMDEAETSFGIRTLELDAQQGLRVNGQEVKLRGACVHHDNGLLGAASFYDSEYRRVKLLKEAGFNAIRTSHNPASPALLKACDQLGMYVMEEAFDAWTRSKVDYDYAAYFWDWWERDLEAMVRDAFNHPSVILYSVGNEIPEIGLEEGAALCSQLAQRVKALDPTRFTTACINGVFMVGDAVDKVAGDVLGQLGEDVPAFGGNVNQFMGLMDSHLDQLVNHPLVGERLDKACAGLDVAGYNYMTGRYERDVAERPQRVIVGSETYPPEIARNWGIITQHPQLIGDFTWTGWDYMGEAGGGVPAYSFGEGGFGAAFPCQLAYVGDLDITGFRRPASYYREIVFGLRKDPYIAVENPYRYGQKLFKTPWLLSDARNSWNYPGMENKPVCVEVYAPGEEVELFLNGVSLGRAPAGPDAGFQAKFETVYTPGALEAVCYKDGKELGRTTLQTPRGKTRVKATVEPGETGELVYIVLEARDDQGVLDFQAATQVRVTVGSNEEFRLGSGNPKPLGNYTWEETTLWEGRALLILRKKCPDAQAHVMVEAGEDRLELTV